MWWLLLTLTWTAMIAGSIHQKITPGLGIATSGSIREDIQHSLSSSVNVDVSMLYFKNKSTYTLTI